MALSTNQHCLGVVLAGGLSSRMGTDKALLTRNNETMLSYSRQQLQQANVADVIISGKEHGIADSVNNLGPMGGIYTVIQKYNPSALLILPVDLPLIDSDSLQQLKKVGEIAQKACFFQNSFLPLYLPITAFVEQFFQDKFSHYSGSLISSSNISSSDNSSAQTSQKGPSIKSLIEQIPHSTLPIKNKLSLFNTNTPEEWLKAQEQFKHQRMNTRIKHV